MQTKTSKVRILQLYTHNQAFLINHLLHAEKHYAKAIEGYTRAIEIDPSNAVYYSNRAFAHIRNETFGAAITDASKAVELDPTYAKGYYRRGDANFALLHFKDAVKDFRLAAKLAPRDPDLRRKLSEAEKELKRIRFEEALSTPEDGTMATDNIILDDMVVEDSYTGPRMDKDSSGNYVLTMNFIKEMMTAFREQKMIHRRFAYQIMIEAQNIFKSLPSLVDLKIPDDKHITVCGDVHGQYYDLERIFELNGLPSEDNPYLFNGDFVDRGSFSVEVILLLLAFKACTPSAMHLTRGNHESRSMNTMYGFYGELKAKLGSTAVEVFRETFCWLPLGFVLNDKVMVVHGGIPTCTGGELDNLRKLDRYREPPDEGPMCEMLWNDPQDEPGLTPNKRGVGVAWGPDVTRQYLETNGLSLVVRSHEVKDEGYELAHDGYCVTIFSAPNYCDQMGNKGAFIRFEGKDMVPHFTQFTAAPHPNVRPMAYAGNMLGGMFGM